MNKKTKISRIITGFVLMILCLTVFTGCKEVVISQNYSGDGQSTGIVSTTQKTDTNDHVKEYKKENSKEDDKVNITYKFRNKSLLKEHFKKHGAEFPYETKEEYVEGANKMLANPNKLHKIEKEDGDDVYYLEETNEFIIVSTDGYIRTYFKPTKGKKYFDSQ